MIRKYLAPALLLLSIGCSSQGNTQDSAAPQTNKEQVTSSTQNAPDTEVGKEKIVGNQQDETSLFSPVKSEVVKKNTEDIANFKIEQYEKLNNTIFGTITFNVNGEPYAGFFQAYAKGEGWVIKNVNTAKVYTDKPITVTIEHGTIDEKAPYRLYSGYINDNKVSTILINDSKNNTYMQEIGQGQKTYLVVKANNADVKEIIALDKNQKEIYKQ